MDTLLGPMFEGLVSVLYKRHNKLLCWFSILTAMNSKNECQVCHRSDAVA